MFLPELPGWTKYCFVVCALGAPFVAAAPGCGEAFSGGATTSSGAAAATGGTHAGGAGALGGAGADEPDAAEADVGPPPDSPEPDGGEEDAGEADAPGADASEDAGECVLTCDDWWGGCIDTSSATPCSPSGVCDADRDQAWALLNCMCAACNAQCNSECDDPSEPCRYCYIDAGSYPECSEELAACLDGTN